MTVLTISRLETAEEKIRKLEDGSTEIIQNEMEHKRLANSLESLEEGGKADKGI